MTAHRIQSLRVLLIPADEDRECEIQWLANRSKVFSDAIGGGSLDEAWQSFLVDVHGDDAGYCLYLDEERSTKALTANERLAVVLARLGETGRDLDLAGDALIVGLAKGGDDIDIPDSVLACAAAANLLPLGAWLRA